METFGKILIWCGDLFASCWSAIADAASAVWGLISTLLQPVMSPMLAWTNPIVTTVGDWYYGWFESLHPAVGLIVTSVLTGAAMLIVFRYTSNQKGIARAKDAIKAELLAVKLYKDDLRVMFAAQGRLMLATLRLQGYMIVPLLIMLLPMLMLLSQMATRYQQRPLRIGERAIVRVDGDDRDAILSSDGVDVEIGPIGEKGDLVWRIRATRVGEHRLNLCSGNVDLTKSLTVGDAGEAVSVTKPGSGWTARLLHPREAAMDGNVAAITVEYPELKSWLYGSDWWVLTFFVVSMVTAIVLKPVFRVKF